jgi:murein L,D-transpeptidase YafK
MISFLPPLRQVLFAVVATAMSLSAVNPSTGAEAAQAGRVGQNAAEAAGQPPVLEAQLAAKGFALGAPAFIRVFKENSTLELWLWRNGRFHPFRSYRICKWSGELGPKLTEGDRQSPEGVYFISGRDLIVNARWHRALNLGYPNSRDKALGLTGSGILIHGKCSSIGCFALTDPVVEDVYDVIAAALDAGQPRITVQVFPFPMTQANLDSHAGAEWHDFWTRLKRGHDLFLRDGLPPRTFVCLGEYAFQSRRARRVSLAGNRTCTPLRKPAVTVVAAAGARLPGRAERAQTPQERARTCNPRQSECRLLRQALASPATCPRKYRRCRNAEIAATKSFECPLKFPRCRQGRGSGRLTLRSKGNTQAHD